MAALLSFYNGNWKIKLKDSVQYNIELKDFNINTNQT